MQGLCNRMGITQDKLEGNGKWKLLGISQIGLCYKPWVFLFVNAAFRTLIAFFVTVRCLFFPKLISCCTSPPGLCVPMERKMITEMKTTQTFNCSYLWTAPTIAVAFWWFLIMGDLHAFIKLIHTEYYIKILSKFTGYLWRGQCVFESFSQLRSMEISALTEIWTWIHTRDSHHLSGVTP